MTIYERAKQFGATFEAACSDVSIYEWEKLMKGHTKANQKKVIDIAEQAGVIDSWWAKKERKHSYFNPYIHYKTKTHLIYVHSGIEHFIRVNS
ncbi:MAG: hypothetical protein KA290_14785 [Chitinophagaceae bacterium]|nr:hypothetical protein [Chitinophagaceae bacterium]